MLSHTPDRLSILSSQPGADPVLLLRRFLCWLILPVVVLGSGGALGAQVAGDAPPQPAKDSDVSRGPNPYMANRGRWNFGLQLGYAVENDIPRNISHINMLIAQPQLRLIVADFKGGPFQRFEIVNEGLLGNAVHPGGRLLGTSLFFHFDFKSRRRLVPFFRLGSAVLHTTLHNRAPEISGSLQFFSQAGVGVQYFFRPQRAFVAEYRYAHMSNAGIEPPNEGFNASMLSIGFRWLRKPRPAGDQAVRCSRNPFHLVLGAIRQVSGL